MLFERVPSRSAAVCFLTLTMASPAAADMFDDPKNLEALPKDISPDKLRATMRGFAINTGSRCSTCHVYEDERDFDTYDFTLDDKEKKLKARQMIRMVADINAYLEENLGKSAVELVSVDCATCHRGLEKPEMMQDVMERSYREGGMESAITEYRQLRDRYYGDYAFDFSPKPLLTLAEKLSGAGDHEAALRFLDLNMEFNPRSTRTLVMKAQILRETGDRAAARESLEQAIELEPENPWLRQMLDSLDAG